MKSVRRNSGIAELLCSSGSRGEALDDIPCFFRALADTFKGGRLPCSCQPLQPKNLVARRQHFPDSLSLRLVEKVAGIALGRGGLGRQDRGERILAGLHLADDLLLGINRLLGSDKPGCAARRGRTGNGLKFARCHSRGKGGFNCINSCSAHAAPERVADQIPFVDDRFALQILVPRVDNAGLRPACFGARRLASFSD